jgi:hypothetical protein
VTKRQTSVDVLGLTAAWDADAWDVLTDPAVLPRRLTFDLAHDNAVLTIRQDQTNTADDWVTETTPEFSLPGLPIVVESLSVVHNRFHTGRRISCFWIRGRAAPGLLSKHPPNPHVAGAVLIDKINVAKSISHS